jgi:hypothetical protein
VFFQKVDTEGAGVADGREVGYDVVYRIEIYPFLTLAIVGYNLGVELFRNSPNGDAVSCLYYKFLFQP